VLNHLVLQSSQALLVLCHGSREFVVIELDGFAMEATLHVLPPAAEELHASRQ